MPSNLNHHDDRARLERIDRLIETGEPGDDALLNMLRRHVPRSRPEFAARLEHELLDEGATSMAHEPGLEIARPVIGGAAVNPTRPRVRRFSLMAAAAVAIAFLGLLAVIGQMSGGSQLQTGAQASVTSTPLPTATFVPTASPIAPAQAEMITTATQTFVPTIPMQPTETVTASATWTITPTQIFVPTPTMVGAGSEGIIWPSVRLVPVDDQQPALAVGSRLAIYTRLQQFASWADTSPGDVADVLLTHQARIVNFLDYAGEYVIELPLDVQPVATWLLSNNAYFVYEVIGTP